MISYVVYKDKLQGEYLEQFEQVEIYANSQLGMMEQDSEEMLSDLLDMLYEAQLNNKPAEKIIGTDVEQFCKSYFFGCTRLGNLLKDIPRFLYRLSVCCFIFTLLDLFAYSEESDSIFTATTDIAPLLTGAVSGIMIGMLISLLVKKLLFRWKKFTYNIYCWMVVMLTILAIVMAVTAFQYFQIALPLFWTLLVSGAYALIYKMVIFVKRYQKYGSITKPQDEVSFKESMKEIYKDGTSTNVILIEMVKSYNKKNEKLAKKGRALVSPEAFTEKIRKQNKWVDYERVFYIVLFLVLTIGSICSIIPDSSFTDIIIFAIIIIVLEGALCRFFYKIGVKSYQRKREMIERCDAEGITLPELARRIEEESVTEEGDKADL